MTEPLFVCEMIWIAVWLVEWRASLDEDARRTSDQAAVAGSPLVLVAAIFTRYDGWVMALLAWTAIGLVLLAPRPAAFARILAGKRLVVAAPIAWFVYNAVAFGDWLDFVRGPYSAKAIEIAHGLAWRWSAASRLAQSVGRAAVLMKVSELDAAAAAWGNALAGAERCWERHGRG